LALNRSTYDRVGGASTPGNTSDTKEPGIGWMTGFLFVSYFVGLTALIPFRKVLLMNESGFCAVKLLLFYCMLFSIKFCQIVVYSSLIFAVKISYNHCISDILDEG